MIRVKSQHHRIGHRRIRPAGVRFIRSSSSLARPAVFGSSHPAAFCLVHIAGFPKAPRRLSSTKPDKSPDLERNCIPSSPLNLETAKGITIPTTRYAASAMRPSSQWKEPINRHMMIVNKKAMAAGEMV